MTRLCFQTSKYRDGLTTPHPWAPKEKTREPKRRSQRTLRPSIRIVFNLFTNAISTPYRWMADKLWMMIWDGHGTGCEVILSSSFWRRTLLHTVTSLRYRNAWYKVLERPTVAQIWNFLPFWGETKAHCLVHNNPLLVPILSQTNPFYTLRHHLVNII
jgi:hypothetical protein